jgi:hypothetical protein
VTDDPAKANVFYRINQVIVPVSALLGTIVVVVNGLYTVQEKGPVAFQLARRITAYVGVMTFLTLAFSLFIVGVFQSYWEKVFGENGALVGIGAVILLEIILGFASTGNIAALDDAYVLQLIGAAVIVYAAYLLYPYLPKSKH